MKTLTASQCEATQVKRKDAYGTRYPYKGKVYGDSYPKLPDGWVYIHIPTWGIHIRKADDTDYQNDL